MCVASLAYVFFGRKWQIVILLVLFCFVLEIRLRKRKNGKKKNQLLKPVLSEYLHCDDIFKYLNMLNSHYCNTEKVYIYILNDLKQRISFKNECCNTVKESVKRIIVIMSQC